MLFLLSFEYVLQYVALSRTASATNLHKLRVRLTEHSCTSPLCLQNHSTIRRVEAHLVPEGRGYSLGKWWGRLVLEPGLAPLLAILVQPACALRRPFPLHILRRLAEALRIMGCVWNFVNLMR